MFKVKKSQTVTFILAASLGLLTFLAYLPALRNEFVNWDDGPYVFANFHIRSFDLNFFRWAFFDFYFSNWHPLTWISHAIDYALWGLNPLGHHLTNIILHAVNTALVVLLVLRLLEVVKGSATGNGTPGFLTERTVLITAGVTGLLFGIHPVHVESVAWVAERKDLLCALFFLLSIMAYVKYARGQGAGFRGQESGAGNQESGVRSQESEVGNQKSGVRSQESDDSGKNGAGGFTVFFNKYCLLSIALFILALMSKPMAVTLPIVLLILDWYPLGRISSFKTLWLAGVEKLPFIALSLVSSIMTILAQKAGDAVTSLDAVPFSIRLLVAAKSLLAYLGKMLLPSNLVPFYPYPKDVSLFSLEYLLALALVLAITLACVVLAKRQKLWLSAWGYYVVTLIPVLGIVQVGSQAMADRYTYLTSLGPFLVAGVGASLIAQKMNTVPRRGLLMKLFSIVIALFLVISLFYLTVEQITVWRTSVNLWTNVINKSTDKVPLMYVNRGVAFEKIGLLDKAVADFESAIALDPSAYRAYISLGTVFETKGQLDKALENVEKAIALSPTSHIAYRNRGMLYEKMLQIDKAIADFTQAITLKPSYFEAYNDRGLAFAKTGQLDKAMADYNEAIAINPRYFSAYTNRGVAFTLTGQYDRALEDFNRAILLGQDDFVAYYNRGMLFRRMGNNEFALSDVRKACDLGNEKACGMLRQIMQ